jgi:hypothetical protein
MIEFEDVPIVLDRLARLEAEIGTWHCVTSIADPHDGA